MKDTPEEFCDRVIAAMRVVGDYCAHVVNEMNAEELTYEKISAMAAICEAAGAIATKTSEWMKYQKED